MNGYNLGPVPVGHTAPSDLVREALPSDVAGDSGPTLDALAAAISSRMVHPESHDQYQVFEVTPGSAVAAGTVLLSAVPLGFFAKTIVVDNPTTYWIEIPELRRKIGPGTNICVPCFPTTRQLSAVVYAGADTSGLAITIIPTERVISTSGGVETAPIAVAAVNAAAGDAVLLEAPPANLSAGAATALGFLTGIRHLEVQNNSSEVKTIEVDGSAATPGSWELQPGDAYFIDATIAAISIYGASATPLNGAVAGNVVVRGFN
jgi:hypothetical protein